MDDFQFDAPEENSLRLEEQDLRILKNILSSSLQANEFAGLYDHTLFIGGCLDFAKNVLSYVKMYKSPPTLKVLLEHAVSEDAKSKIATIWEEIQNVESDPNEFRYDLDKLKHRFKEHKLQGLKDIINSSNDIDLAIKQSKTQLDLIQQVSSGKKKTYIQKTLADYMPEFREDYTAKFNNKDYNRGILTGYSYFDHIKNGMSPGEMLLIGADTGLGKSMLLNNMALQMFLQKNTIYTPKEQFTKGYNVLLFSLEMPFNSMARRTMSRLADVNSYDLRDAKLSAYQLKSLAHAAKFLENYDNHFEIVDVPRGLTIDGIEERMQDAMTRYFPDIVVVDYLGLLEDPKSEGDDWLKLAHIAGKLHELGRLYGVIILSAVQLNRPNNKSTKDTSELIGIHRIGRSSGILHHANVAIQIECRHLEQNYSDMKYHVIKNRDGELGSGTFIKNFANSSITDSPEPYQPTINIDGYEDVLQNKDDITELLKKYKWNK